MLCVLLITRNEAATIANAIRSVLPVADEVILTDTGSTDATVEIARFLSPKVKIHHFPWTDDFGAARTFAGRRVPPSCTWVLGVDADEELLPSSYDELRRCMMNPNALGYLVRLDNTLDETDPTIRSDMTSVRLFRYLPDVQFVGRIHERLSPSIGELVKRERKPILPSTIILRHGGFSQQKSDQKLFRAAHLLKLELQDRPDQLYYLIEYGRTLLLLKQPDARQVLSRAAEILRKDINAPRPPFLLVALLLEYLLDAPTEAIDSQTAESLAVKWFANAPPLLFKMARRAFAANDFAKAARCLEQLLDVARTGEYDRTLSFHPRIFGEDTELNLAVCYARTGQIAKARGIFHKLSTSPRLGQFAKQNLQLIAGM